jgi:hypothetical protein
VRKARRQVGNAQHTKANNQIVRQVLERVSDTDLDVLGSAARALAQGRELTPAESAAAEAYASAIARESALR